MKLAREWLEELASVSPGSHLRVMTGAGGLPVLKYGSLFVHSRYRPREEAARLVETAALDLSRPVLVVGLGLGYHVAELLDRGAAVGVVELDRGVAKLALEGPLGPRDFLLGLGDAASVTAAEGFQDFAKRLPQVLVHPSAARLHPEFVETIQQCLVRAALDKQRLGIAVVGPLYGGSLPIASYLERAFRRLGHRTLYVDNSVAWKLHQTMSDSIKKKRAADQLSQLLLQALGEWSYARVAEFAPDICIVIAQAPVTPVFPVRLRNRGVVTAFWFVENWRHLDYWKGIAPHYDSFFHIQPGEFERRLAEIGCTNHAFLPTACDPEVHKPVELTAEEREEYECDISFAGAGYPNRNQFFAGLTDYRFKLWGVNWIAPELKPLVCCPEERFTADRFARVVAGSKINLNLHSSTTHPGVDPQCDAVNPRVFEIAACGGFQLCDPCKGLEYFFDFDSELPVYRNLAELRTLIDHYLAHPEERKQFARRARERVLRDHTYENRAQQMLQHILERHGRRILKKGVRVQRTIGEMVDRVGRDSPLGKYLSSLPPDLVFTQETINEQLTSAACKLSYPEAVFAYLRDLRMTAEALLDARDYGPGA